jgi:sugar phosphate permease
MAIAGVTGKWENNMIRVKNWKMSAWIGSILLHMILLSLILFWFTYNQDRFVPSVRTTAVGAIVFHTSGGKPKEMGAVAQHTAEIDLTAINDVKFAQGNLHLLPAIPTL